ncbi:glutamate racemase [Brytella acorum]|uniref:Glutamate racemase n=1 Tax=Brytella acorum TaxID=2959299 RepID=A0AA35UNH8_9PROT|nr:glutamate racemase [Brytella acorum]MDF3624190.1 glutamate racemase [Brytella acorum]CAI9120696.1 glutamate racemase [Brytella acorum]
MSIRPRGRVLAFDSGIGGLGVVRALREALPQGTKVDYLADNALFPYGEQDDDLLVSRLLTLIGEQIEARRPDLVLIACNTASTLALEPLRARFSVPFVGCVPPVRWAARVSISRVIGILATAATVRRPYLGSLHRAYATDCIMITHGARGLADLAERAFLGEDIPEVLVSRELAALFGQLGGEDIDTVGLGCTHYTFLTQTFARLGPAHVTWLDPAASVARQAATVLEQHCDSHSVRAPREAEEEMILTAPPPEPERLRAAIARMGYGGFTVLERPAPSRAAPQFARLTV